MFEILIAGIVQSETNEAVKNFPIHTVGETIGGFLFAAVKHVWGFLVIPLRSEVHQIGTLLMRFSVMRWMQGKISESFGQLKSRFKKKEVKGNPDA